MKKTAEFIRALLVPLFLLFLSSVDAQELVVMSGKVVDTDSKPVPYASVVVTNLNPVVGTKSDEQGRYSMQLPAGKEIEISVRCTGFETADTVLTTRQNAPLNIVFSLKKQTTQLDVVKVTEEKNRKTTFTTVNIEKVENNVGPQGGVESLLKTLPDVSSNNEMSSQYSVRGGSFDENLVYINGVEIFRPTLVRNGQQEGTSIINPDMVSFVKFSPGGFDATYGDRMASVLDIAYSTPYAQGDTASGKTFHDTRGQLSASMLGASLSLQGAVGDRLSYSIGFRQHSNRYIFRTLDTKGNYNTSYTDLQGLIGYRINEALDLQLLVVATRNLYGLVPSSQTTTFGGWQEVMQFDVYYEGEERDSYRTALASLALDFHPGNDYKLRFTNSFQSNREVENYDILSQFMLYELNVGNVDENGETSRFDRGIGSFLEHARNSLQTNYFSSMLQGTHYARMGNWNWGVKVQYEQVRDKMREWKWVDSAGYAMPTVIPTPGVDSNMPSTPILQQFCRSNHTLGVMRLSAYAQRNVDFYTRHDHMFSIVAGIRGQWYDIDFTNDNLTGNVSNYPHEALFDETSPHNRGFILSPRLSLNFKPNIKRDILFRLAAGVYSQAPTYREYRSADGRLNHSIRPQDSYQLMGTIDWNFRIDSRPFKLTTDVYYKYIDDLISYSIDNLRMRYSGENNAVGYATGLSLRLSGEVVDGLESWASLSLMRTREDIEGDAYGWLPRPTDQRVSFKIFFQDYVPSVPFWRMSLNFIVSSGLPFTYPTQKDFSIIRRYPAYFRVDWGNTIQLSRFERIRSSRLMQYVDDILLSVELFNIFDYRNVVSFIFVSDYNNQYYPVPNYLTARQLNFKVTVKF